MKIINIHREITHWNRIDTNHFVLRIFGVMCWASSINEKRGWFIVFGYGITWKHKDEPKLFSERLGYSKALKIGVYRFRYLPYT